MNYIYIVLIIFAIVSILLGIYVGYIQNKYVDINYDNVLNFSNTFNLSKTLKMVADSNIKIDKTSIDKKDSDFKKPVIIKTMLVEECLEMKDEEII